MSDCEIYMLVCDSQGVELELTLGLKVYGATVVIVEENIVGAVDDVSRH
jgi:hypothetical protein